MRSIQSRFLRFLCHLTQIRRKSDESIEHFRADLDWYGDLMPLPLGTVIERLRIGEMPAAWVHVGQYDPSLTILYLHGGGFIMGSIRSHRSLIARISRAARARTLALDYRLAPEYPFPAAHEDSLAAYRWLLSQGVHPEHIVIAGDSAGGNLTLSMLLALRDAGEPLPAAAVCLSPATDLSGQGETLLTLAKRDPVLTLPLAAVMARAYLGNNDPLAPHVSPLYGDPSGLPPLLIQVGSEEMLLSDSTRFAERAAAAGVDVTLDVWDGMWHVWQFLGSYLPEGQEAIGRAGRFIREHIKISPGKQSLAA